MRRTKSALEGKTVWVMTDMMEQPIEGLLRRCTLEPNDDEHGVMCYIVESGEYEWIIPITSVSTITTKKQKYRHLRVVQLDTKAKN